MGLRGIFPLIIIFLILMMVFGTHRLRNVGTDLALAIRGFRKALDEGDESKVKEEPKA